jgi:ABC-type spermidine/putrescine transport system permease subunit II
MSLRYLSIYSAILSVVFVFPLLIVVAVSLDPGDYIRFPVSGYSLRWYVEMWSNQTIVLALKNSLIVGVASSLIGALVAVPAALVAEEAAAPVMRSVTGMKDEMSTSDEVV